MIGRPDVELAGHGAASANAATVSALRASPCNTHKRRSAVDKQGETEVDDRVTVGTGHFADGVVHHFPPQIARSA